MTRYPVTPTTSNPDRRWHASCSMCTWQTTGGDVRTVARIGAIHVDQVCTDASLTVQRVAYVGGGRRG